MRHQLGGGSQEGPSVDDLRLGAVATYARAMNNLDDVLSLADIEDAAVRQALKSDFSETSDLNRYDFDRDGRVTQGEIALFYADEAWKAAFAPALPDEDFAGIRARFDQQLDKRVGRFLDLAGLPETGDIVVEAPADFTERGLDALTHRDAGQLPYMAVFDLDQSRSVTFEEFLVPLTEAIMRADTDGNGLFDKGEMDRIEARHKDLDKQLKSVDGKFGFPAASGD